MLKYRFISHEQDNLDYTYLAAVFSRNVGSDAEVLMSRYYSMPLHLFNHRTIVNGSTSTSVVESQFITDSLIDRPTTISNDSLTYPIAPRMGLIGTKSTPMEGNEQPQQAAVTASNNSNNNFIIIINIDSPITIDPIGMFWTATCILLFS